MACTREHVLISPVGVTTAAQPVVSLASPRDNLAVFSGEDGGRFPRLSELLRLDALREARILTGAGGMWHEVETVEILEAVDVAVQVRRQALFLATGLAARAGSRNPEEIITRLSRGGAAGLALQEGNDSPFTCPAVIELADKLRFPVIALPLQLAFSEVIKAGMWLIFSRKEPAVSSVPDLAALVAKAVLDGGDLNLLVQLLSGRLQNTVIVTDRDYQVLTVSSAGKGTGNRAGRRNIRTRTLELFLRGLENPAEALAEGASSFVLPLPAGGEIAGYLAVLEEGRKVSPAERSALEQAGFLVAMAILKCCFADRYERRRQSDLIFELVEGSGEMEAALDDRVRPGLEKPGHILWVELASPAGGKAPVRGEAEPGPAKLKEKALALLAGHLTSRHKELVVARQADKLLLFLPAEDGKADEKRMGAVAANLREELAALMPAWEVALGVSRPCCGHRDWPAAYREAQEAARIGAELGGGGKVYRFGDMGGYQLLARLRGSNELTGFYQSVLGKLDRLEAHARNEMIKTLEMHFAANGSINRMAELMYMHRNSLKYRLDKIEELLGVDLDDPEVRFNLQLALRIRHFLQ